jgi:hypothetical protein
MVMFNSYVSLPENKYAGCCPKLGLNVNLITFSWGDGIYGIWEPELSKVKPKK